MNQTNRARKVAALTKLMQGNKEPLKALQPPMIIDLDQFSPDELEAIRHYQEAYHAGQDYTAQQAHVEALIGGRELRMIPQPVSPTF